MNRIILIGNGFDLAHGMKTSYKDFIEWCWGIIKDALVLNASNTESVDKYGFVKFKVHSLSNTRCISDVLGITLGDNLKDLTPNAFIKLIKEKLNKDTGVIPWLSDVSYGNTSFRLSFENTFFKTIFDRMSESGWAGIEQLYYDELCEVKNNESLVEKLNLEFEIIKNALADYLLTLEGKQLNYDIFKYIYSPIIFSDIEFKHTDKYIGEIIHKVKNVTPEERVKFIYTNAKDMDNENVDGHFIQKVLKLNTQILEDDDSLEYQVLKPDNVLILSFNYTDLANRYSLNHMSSTKLNIESSSIYIHGELDETSNNPVVFGYGDEYDSQYSVLQYSRTKRVLDNIKSMKYLETSNYRNLEKFINSEYYQVVIMGHSCSLSDNTLLKTLFEHENCVSIKPYFYENKNKSGEIVWDNYNELIQALSRCFDDKAKLRSVVVNKGQCLPLPQSDH